MSWNDPQDMRQDHEKDEDTEEAMKEALEQMNKATITERMQMRESKRQLKVSCLSLAIQMHKDEATKDNVVETAKTFYNFAR